MVFNLPSIPSAAGSVGVEAGSVEALKEQGNEAFKKAQLLKRTTAGRQYLDEAKQTYIAALKQLGSEEADDRALSLACVLHCNIAAVYLLETPSKYEEAKAACDIALAVDSKSVKALYRRAQATLEDYREGLPESSLQIAFADLEACCAIEPTNAKIKAEADRIRKRLAVIEEKRKVPAPSEIMGRVSRSLLDRGLDCVDENGYSWGQTDTVIHIFIPARGVRLAKTSDVSCEFHPRSLSLVLPTAEGKPDFKLKGPLHRPVRPDDCSWQLEDGGLLLHVELAKRDSGEEDEHWMCVWSGHAETKAPSGKERRDVESMARAAVAADAREQKEELDPAKEARLNEFRAMFPGVPCEWGDTSLSGFR